MLEIKKATLEPNIKAELIMLSFFVIKINWILVVGLLLSLAFSIWFYYKDKKNEEIL